VVSRVCDHAGGTLIQSPIDASKALCPLHNWEFDFDTLSYSNMPNQIFENITKRPLNFRIERDELVYETEQNALRVPNTVKRTVHPNTPASLRYIAHASVLLEVDGVRMLTDPWFVGECLGAGWWLQHPPKDDAWEIAASADFLYISHNHPDHLHAETLAQLPRDMPIIAPRFANESVGVILRAMGFTNVMELELLRLYRVNGSDLLISILPTSDHREDSALFVTKGDFSAVLTVDCVGANKYVLPTDVTLLLTNFASGASGWPLCYDVVGTVDERAKIVTKNRGTAQLEVMKYVAATRPRIYMPYAGFFEEKAPRDAMIQRYNIKNTPQQVLARVAAKHPQVLGVNPLDHDTIHWNGQQATLADTPRPPLYAQDAAYIGSYLDAQSALLADFDAHRIADYFLQSEFRDALIVYLVLTDDDYVPNGESLRLDFSGTPMRYDVVDGAALLAKFNALGELNGMHHLMVKARRDSLWRLVREGRPLEELTLGFQCRIDRKPDQYNAAFWKHYTSVGAPILRGEDRLLAKLLEGANG
jgi:CMP-N-acetylneuraminate monooxygenase